MNSLLLMRHSVAVRTNFQTPDDARWLTSEGRALAIDAARALGSTLAEAGRSLDCIVCSPLVRAVQTAELVAQELGYTLEITAHPWLRSESPTQRAVDALLARAGRATVLAVSHEPLVSTISTQIVGRSGTLHGYHPSEIRCLVGVMVGWRHLP